MPEYVVRKSGKKWKVKTTSGRLVKEVPIPAAWLKKDGKFKKEARGKAKARVESLKMGSGSKASRASVRSDAAEIARLRASILAKMPSSAAVAAAKGKKKKKKAGAPKKKGRPVYKTAQIQKYPRRHDIACKGLTVAELREQASRLKIPGRSHLKTKKQLCKVLGYGNKRQVCSDYRAKSLRQQATKRCLPGRSKMTKVQICQALGIPFAKSKY